VFYTALTYNGVETWHPPHQDDVAILAAFQTHQGRDKGFGLSAGPKATDVLAQAFGVLGYAVKTGDSPWQLAGTERTLMRELAAGVAQAVRETGRVDEKRIGAWLRIRSEGGSCTIGHTDLLATP
jgi:hypothetical protein